MPPLVGIAATNCQKGVVLPSLIVKISVFVAQFEKLFCVAANHINNVKKKIVIVFAVA